ncbi:hypothetical protein HY501_02035 [Candidatus Woesearchaeota archaeon]|nr:hypothetical protein [Candidatus Woesearchaeota archaeon]
MARLNAENAKKVLGDCAQEHEFWVCNSQKLKNLNELAEALQKMDENVFAAHSNQEKKDFSNWVGDIFGDVDLAKQLSTTDRRKAHSAVSKRIQQLSLLAEQKPKKARPKRRK